MSQGQQRIGSSTPPRTIYLPVDVGYYAPAARTTLNRVFLSPCLSVDSAPSPSTSPSTPSLGNRRVRSATRLWVPLEPPRHFGAVRGEVRRRLDLRLLGRVHPLQRRARR